MHRFYLPPELCGQDRFDLEGREAHHALHVLRVRKGDPLEVLDGAGRRLFCQAIEVLRDHLRLAIIKTQFIDPSPFSIHLLQAVPKGKLMESIIQKATELGASRIIPILSERVVLRLDPKEREQKREKWQQTAVEAIKQCGAAWLPKVESPLTPEEFIARKDSFEMMLLGCLQPGSTHPREQFRHFFREHGRNPNSVCIWVGPEGDFTVEEVEAIKASGALPVTLGPLVLRSETAALYCLSVVNYELQTPIS